MYNNLEGKIIYIFGIDGSGKTTLLNNLALLFENKVEINRVLSDHSGGAYTDELERLENKYGIDKKLDISSGFENIIYTLDHLYKAINYVEPSKKSLILLDRYYICNWVFSKITNEDTVMIEKIHTLFPRPHYNIFIEIDWEIAWDRIKKRNRKITMKERPENLKKAAVLYNEYIEKFNLNVIRVNGNQSPSAICKQVADQILERGDSS